MDIKSDSEAGNGRDPDVVYVYSPEYIDTCDSLSKVPKRVRIKTYSISVTLYFSLALLCYVLLLCMYCSY